MTTPPPLDLSSLSPTYFLPLSTSTSSPSPSPKPNQTNQPTETTETNQSPSSPKPNQTLETTETTKIRHQLTQCKAPLAISPHDATFFLVDTTSRLQVTEELGRVGITVLRKGFIPRNYSAPEPRGLGGLGGLEGPQGPGQDGPGGLEQDKRYYQKIKVVSLKWFWDSSREGTMLNMRGFTVWEGRVEVDPDFLAQGSQGSQGFQGFQGSPATAPVPAPKDLVGKMEEESEESKEDGGGEEGGEVAMDLDEDMEQPQQQEQQEESKRLSINKILEDVDIAKRKRQLQLELQRLQSEQKRMEDEEASNKLINKILEDENIEYARNFLEGIKEDNNYEANKRIKGWKYNAYSCCWPTPAQTKNDLFVSDLVEIRKMLNFRACYSEVNDIADAIASIRAYPYTITSADEILGLPHCPPKVAEWWQEWHDSSPDPTKRKCDAVKAAEDNLPFSSAQMFWKILGLREALGTKFATHHQLFTLDDLSERFWNRLSRIQKIGICHYQELTTPIPRWEVKDIAKIILHHATIILPQIQARIVGTYRRGLTDLSEVEILLSYPPSKDTIYINHTSFMVDLVASLQSVGLIPYTLSINRSTNPPASNAYQSFSHDPDESLDKAYLVWRHNVGLHRLVTVIFVPPIAAGTALIYYTGGTTFVRHLVRYCNEQFGADFMSDGVYRDGFMVEDLEVGWQEGETWEGCEVRIMQRLELEWRKPEERCTE